MKSIQFVVFVIALTISTVSQAGLIRDGLEWEARGDDVNWVSHSNAAAGDTGWIWADNAAVDAAGFFALLMTLSEQNMTALYGTLFTGSSGPDLWLANVPVPVGGNSPISLGRKLVGPACTSQGNAILFCDFGGVVDQSDGQFNYRLSYREAVVPEPTTLALMGLGLAGIGYGRKRNNG